MTMTDLSLVASRLSRAADLIENEAGEGDAEVWSVYDEAGKLVCSVDSRAVAALVPLLRRAAALAQAGATYGADRTGDTLTGYLAAFAALLLGEEEQ